LIFIYKSDGICWHKRTTPTFDY